jgi:hypothetical protein
MKIFMDSALLGGFGDQPKGFHIARDDPLIPLYFMAMPHIWQIQN